jgi:hypothetical protein
MIQTCTEKQVDFPQADSPSEITTGRQPGALHSAASIEPVFTLGQNTYFKALKDTCSHVRVRAGVP